ncbi:MAG: cellulase family glycosylhydrolase [Treponema sp.]|nr:cellulase family glycosylhydrolase [Treponema sp.]
MKSKLIFFALIAATIFASCSAKESKSAGKTKFPLLKSAEESSIYIEPCPKIGDDFICGMDASAVLSVEKSGAKFYGFDGNEQDVFLTLAQGGINYVRFRVWNDPFDENGNGYGGGNNDLATAIELGKRATAAGLKTQIDFHYSDFWADPKRQHAPKAWQDLDIEKKSAALYEFTKSSLEKLLDAGVDVAMVQVGNEINNGMSGEKGFINVAKLLQEGSRAVREVAKSRKKEIAVALHYTHINRENYPDEITRIAMSLKNYKIDYDIMGLSYYPFWDGTMANMQSVVKMFREEYGKKVMIAETSYPFTSEDGDGFGNAFAGKEKDLVSGYPATVQGQARAVRDVCALSCEAGAMGVFYWEGTWIPVGKATEDNSPKWEKFGSGWASSYCAKYDPEDGGLYYGGGSWDNQAMFDFYGRPLESLKVWRYLRYGTKCQIKIDFIPSVEISCDVGGAVNLPSAIPVIMNNGKTEQFSVQWNQDDVKKISTQKAAVFSIGGKVEDKNIFARFEVKSINHAKNPSFEEADTSMWKVTSRGENPTDFQKKEADAHSGKTALHFYSEQEMDFEISQTLEGLENGIYAVSLFAQGGDVSKDSRMEVFAISGGKEVRENFMVTTWVDWKNPKTSGIKVSDGKLTFGARIKCNAKGWGTLDDFSVFKID